MGKIEAYLKERAKLLSGERVESGDFQPDSTVTISAILFGSEDSDSVTIAFLNKKFVLKKSDVIDIVDATAGIPNPFGRGVPVTIVIKGDAVVTATESLRAVDLVAGLPYALARPSLSPDIPVPEFSEKEFAWRSERGLLGPDAPEAYTPSYCPSTSPSYTKSRTGNAYDDYNNDGYHNDDQTGDDAKRDVLV
jgi:hypothetical protein